MTIVLVNYILDSYDNYLWRSPIWWATILILYTSITTIVRVIPLALSDPTWFPLVSAIGFGLVASTLIALLVIPCLYLLLTPNKSMVNVV